MSGRAGAKPTPQLPNTTVVTPCQQVGVSSGSQVIWPSKCVWMSTKPGVTSRPSASIVRRASVLASAPASVDLGHDAVGDRDVGHPGLGSRAVDERCLR